jgi:hypothetical protein
LWKQNGFTTAIYFAPRSNNRLDEMAMGYDEDEWQQFLGQANDEEE